VAGISEGSPVRAAASADFLERGRMGFQVARRLSGASKACQVLRAPQVEPRMMLPHWIRTPHDT
jgi:hypothetical protein